MKVICVVMLFFVFLSLPYKYGEPKAKILLNGPMIQINPDSLFFETMESYDTLLVVNHGDVDLVIDSVKTYRGFGYGIVVVTKDTTFGWSVVNLDIEQFKRNRLILAPGNTAQLIVFSPDLCPVCKSNSFLKFFTDTLFVYSNDSAHNPVKIFASGEGIQSAVEESSIVPEGFILRQNYPNPFNPQTTIEYAIPHPAHVRLEILNTLGQRVAVLIDQKQNAGKHQATWTSNGHSSGTYFFRINSGGFQQTKRMTLVEIKKTTETRSSKVTKAQRLRGTKL